MLQVAQISGSGPLSFSSSYSLSSITSTISTPTTSASLSATTTCESRTDLTVCKRSCIAFLANALQCVRLLGRLEE